VLVSMQDVVVVGFDSQHEGGLLDTVLLASVAEAILEYSSQLFKLEPANCVGGFPNSLLLFFW